MHAQRVHNNLPNVASPIHSIASEGSGPGRKAPLRAAVGLGCSQAAVQRGFVVHQAKGVVDSRRRTTLELFVVEP